MEYKVDILKVDEIEELSRLFNVVYKKKNYDDILRRSKWAFDNNHSCVVIAKHDGKIVGSRGGLHWPLQVDGLKLRGLQSISTCVHPEHRRKGLFTLLNKKYLEYSKKNRVDYIFNVSVNLSRLGNEKLGWKYHKGFHRLTCFNKPLNLKVNRANKETPHYQQLDIGSVIDTIDDRFFKARDEQFSGYVHTVYSKEFLKWRLGNERIDYRIYEDDKAVVIYKVVNTNKKTKSLIIGDVFLIEDSALLFLRIINKVMKAERPDISYTYISRSHPYFSYYIFRFFLPNPFNFNLNFGTRKITGEEEREVEGKKWATSYLDLDTF